MANARRLMEVGMPGATAGELARQINLGLGTTVHSASPKLAAALVRVKNRTGRARFLFVGDSLTRSWGDGFATGPGTGSVPQPGTTNGVNSYPAQLAALMQNAGIPTRWDAFFGSGNIAAGAAATDISAAYDGRVTLGAGWNVSASAQTVGGRVLNNTADTTSLTFAPMVAADTFEIYHIPGAQFTVTDASGTLATINQGAFAATKTVVTRSTASLLPISIQKVAAANTLYVAGIIPSCSFMPTLELINGGGGGSATAQWVASGGLNPLAVIPLITADAAVAELGANDASGGVDAGTYQANYLTVAQAIVATGADLYLAKTNRSLGQSATGFDVPPAYLAAVDAVATAAGARGVIDFNNASLGYTSPDFFDAVGPHLSAQGYGKKAVTAFRTIVSLL